jgi:hypothetical protein
MRLSKRTLRKEDQKGDGDNAKNKKVSLPPENVSHSELL